MVYRMLVIGIGALLSLSATAPPTKVCGCSAVPSFEALATPPEHVALPKLDLSSHPIGPRYRTILRRAVASQPPNLAGHYLLFHWGCGSSCQLFAIINLETGKIWHDPELILTRGVQTRATSSLVVLNPPGYPFPDSLAATYYQWHGDHLEPLCLLRYSADNLRPACDGSLNPSLQPAAPGRSPARRR